MTRRFPLLVTLSPCLFSPTQCRPNVFWRAASTRAGASGEESRNNSSMQFDSSGVYPRGFSNTIFTLPGASKTAVLNKLEWLETPEQWQNAAVILASPRHASWLTDHDFMAPLICNLQKHNWRLRNQRHDIHVLAAVVDGLYPQPPSLQMREGISIHFGRQSTLLPGLWDPEPSNETVEKPSTSAEPGSETAHLSVVLKSDRRSGKIITVNLPLTNTLFHNGRRTTLLASTWRIIDSWNTHVEMLRTQEKRAQTVELGALHRYPQSIPIESPLVPITHPRKILESLGNILAKVEIEGEPSPASKEIQVNIPRLLASRQARSASSLDSGRIGVWALIIPEHLMDKATEEPAHDATQEGTLNFATDRTATRLVPACHKLAFDFCDSKERSAWQQTILLSKILMEGGRVHKILSGGGEWGTKASLLSLDPQTGLGEESEEDELNKFQRSFNGEHSTGETMIRPGDYVQFFVEGDSQAAAADVGSVGLLNGLSQLQYPAVVFGVGEFREDLASDQVDESLWAQKRLVQLRPNHFGAFSADGLYLDVNSGHRLAKSSTCKVDTLGTTVTVGKSFVPTGKARAVSRTIR